MRAVSDAFLAAVTGSHDMVSIARVIEPGQSGTNPGGTDLQIIDGNVAFDSTAQIRGTIDLTVDGTDWSPRVGAHPVQPYGNEVWVARGIRIGGSVELVSQGYYTITEVTQASAPNGNLRITGQDRMSIIAGDRFTAPRQFFAEVGVADTITQLAQESLPSVVVDFNIPDAPLGRNQSEDQDRAGFMQNLVTALGGVMFFDYNGHLVVNPVPTLDNPVWTVESGDGGVMIQASKTLSRTGIYNGVVASGEGADTTTPVSALAVDGDPKSPTYWYGSYGRVPGFFTSATIVNPEQAGTAAAAALRKILGVPYSIDLTAVPNPALATDDVIRVRDPDVTGLHLVQKLTIPLTAAAAMTGTTRSGIPSTIEVS